MQPPREYKDIQKLIGFLATLSLFISKSGECNQPFFKNLRRASNGVISSVLVREIEEDQRPIYYVVTDQPLKRVISSPQLSERLTTWAIELSEFDISYVPRTSIKAQALVDIIIKCTSQPPQVISGLGNFVPKLNNPEWVLFLDVARNEKGSGAGVLIRGPVGVVMDYALRFTFPTTNNEAEYEALVAGLTIVNSLGIDCIWVKSESKFIMDQVKGVCRVKHEPLIKYHSKTIQLAKGFK
ncbi:hypothetical protein LIER_32363 [Lithospermum erythrorhizon]|uniref:RNase H type-1 domain-containing protein n=1 Tax=Lithospermum erythrorhizon TaxID=34254 RepID=A0AAV3RX33_LITER